MKKNNEQKLNEILAEFKNQKQLKSNLIKKDIMQAWENIFGDFIKSYTLELRYYDNTVIVKLNSSSLKNELMMNRQKILDQLRQRLPDLKINDIEIR
ncbi:MAG TPA: DUF721 domain-containing protein [Saprospiraceae bacterium]|nr:DUF721 domain-containing protein [Saprospiraceae bacterium]